MSENNAKDCTGKRIEWMNVVKGLEIICVVYGHTIFKDELWRIWIYSFHMPIFFFLSGVTYRAITKKNISAGR